MQRTLLTGPGVSLSSVCRNGQTPPHRLFHSPEEESLVHARNDVADEPDLCAFRGAQPAHPAPRLPSSQGVFPRGAGRESLDTVASRCGAHLTLIQNCSQRRAPPRTSRTTLRVHFVISKTAGRCSAWRPIRPPRIHSGGRLRTGRYESRSGDSSMPTIVKCALIRWMRCAIA